jgi:hypothetical protein
VYESPKPKGNRGPLIHHLEPAVPGSQAFEIVIDSEVSRRNSVDEASDLRVREVGFGSGERDGELARWVNSAEEDIRDRLTAADAGVPRFEDALHVHRPRHLHRTARLQHDNRVGIGGGDGSDELILLTGRLRVAASWPSTIHCSTKTIAT